MTKQLEQIYAEMNRIKQEIQELGADFAALATKHETQRQEKIKLAIALKEAEQLITRMAGVFFIADIQDRFPYGLSDDVKAYVKKLGSVETLWREALTPEKVNSISPGNGTLTIKK